jgi:hypothetical protein
MAQVLRLACAQAVLQIAFASWDVLWHEETWCVGVCACVRALVVASWW